MIPMTSTEQSRLPAVIYTDAKLRTIFYNFPFLNLFGYERHSNLLGTPVHEVLRLPKDNLQSLIEQGSLVDRSPLTLEFELPYSLLCLPQTVRNTSGEFLGLNLAFGPTEETRQFEEVSSKRMLAFIYFADQFNMLQVALARLAGDLALSQFNEAFNRLAQGNGWRISVTEARQLEAHTEALNASALITLLENMVQQASLMLGQSRVRRLLAENEAAITPGVVSEAEAQGLRAAVGLK